MLLNVRGLDIDQVDERDRSWWLQPSRVENCQLGFNKIEAQTREISTRASKRVARSTPSRLKFHNINIETYYAHLCRCGESLLEIMLYAYTFINLLDGLSWYNMVLHSDGQL